MLEPYMSDQPIFRTEIHKTTWTRIKHVGQCCSYTHNDKLKLVNTISGPFHGIEPTLLGPP